MILRSSHDRRDEVVDERERRSARRRGSMTTPAAGISLAPYSRVVEDHVERAAVVRDSRDRLRRPGPASSAAARRRRGPSTPRPRPSAICLHARDDALARRSSTPLQQVRRRPAATTSEQDDVADPPEGHRGLRSATIAALRAIPGSAPRMMSNCALIAVTAPSSGRRCSASTPCERGRRASRAPRRSASGRGAPRSARRRARARRPPPARRSGGRGRVCCSCGSPNPSVSAFM